ncbi:MAG: efflux RND transporter periplasmic adaptor subunit [Luteibacter sp.]|uniref:efflux RND transporter periplasmic adaptor subunit n=1 Tax=Luteibacter sp. TaxID=1886636 RepID=UPI002809BA21|nr:efflux RND transporter periplasmic adaptor subunit [Luteibacter sp.]MDQ7997219.1 efflux RND transporter periplasmic adaptor subunit [Luteibacter sp.]MDQ8049439.1 efflux RND transporter periplasmic adaptor subunit [Luteibacter sp.]
MAKQSSRGTVAVVGIVAVAAIVWWVGHGKKDGASVADQAVPVVTATVRQGGFVVYRVQPGTVTPFNSVLVRSQVDGVLTRVAFSGGQQVRKGDLLAEIDPRASQAQLQLATGDLGRSQAQLANAEETLKHYEALLAQDSISRQRVADQRSLVRQYAAEVKSEQGRIGSANLQVSNARIVSPISGMVGLRRVDPGNLVGPSDARGIVTVTQSQPSKVLFSVPVNVVPRVLARLNGGACIPVDAYGDGPDDKLGTGHLLAANNQVDPTTGTVKFEAEFANADGALLPNQFVTAKLPVDVLPQAILVPSAAIQQGAQGPFVYAIKDDKTAAVVPVKLGAQDASTTVIASGIAAGAKVVVEGADRLRAGTKVQATAAAEPAQTPAADAPSCHRDEASASARTSTARS